jgi:hypothetical protein
MRIKKNSRACFWLLRIVADILNAMKKVYPETKIGPIADDKLPPNIIKPCEVPMNHSKLKQYLATPIRNKRGILHG